MSPLQPAMQAPICLYSKTLLNCLPGNCRITPFISRSKSVARTSEEFKPDRFHEVINMHRLVCAEQLIELFLRPVQGRGPLIDSAVRLPVARPAGGRRTGVGSSSITSAGAGDELGTLFDEEVRRELPGWVTLPGTPKTSLPNSMARRAVISEPLYCGALPPPATPSGMPATMRLRTGKFSGAGWVRSGNSLMIGAALQHFFVQLLVFLRVADINARAGARRWRGRSHPWLPDARGVNSRGHPTERCESAAAASSRPRRCAICVP